MRKKGTRSTRACPAAAVLLAFLVSCAGTQDTRVNNIAASGVEENEPESEVSLLQDDLLPEKYELNFKNDNGLEVHISTMEYIAFVYVYSGRYSPDREVLITDRQNPGNRDKLNIYKIVWKSDIWFSPMSEPGIR